MKANVTVRLVLISLALLVGFPVSQAQALDSELTAEARLLYLTREENDSHTLATALTPGGVDFLNSSDLNLGWEPGLDASLAYRIGDFKAEVRYFGLHDFFESHDLGFANILFLGYETSPIPIWAGFDLSADYESTIHNVEFNLHWYPIDRLSLLFGARYIKIEEGMNIYFDSSVYSITFAHKTDNNMLGAQLGIQGDFLRIGERFKVSGFAKGGYLRNDYDVDIDATSSLSSGKFLEADNGDDPSTFFGEVGINLSYVIFNHFAVTAGYQFLYIDKTALAPNLVTDSDPFNGSASIRTDSVYYHGATAGITIFW